MEPADWKAKRAMGMSSRKSGPEDSEASAGVWGMRSASMRATAMMIRIDWQRKERTRVPRPRGLKWRVISAKVKEPTKKKTIEIRDFSHPNGLLTGWLEAPRPRKMVFPGV